MLFKSRILCDSFYDCHGFKRKLINWSIIDKIYFSFNQLLRKISVDNLRG